MKNILKIKFLSIAVMVLFGTVLFTSCDETESYEVGLANVIEASGDWVVEIEKDGEHYDHNTISTYNTSDDSSSEIWLDDQGHGWGLKSKVNINLEDLTFSGNDLEEVYYGVTVTITDGAIIKNGSTAPSGTVVDSISFYAEFSDDPGVIWHYYGYKRTGFAEDEP